MAEQAVAEGIGGELGAPGAFAAHGACRGAPRGRSGRLPLLFIVLLNLLAVGAAAGAYLLASPGSAPVAETVRFGGSEAVARDATVTYDLPDLRVTLTGADGGPRQLTISAALEADGEATIERLRAVMPLVLENFRVYLRELGAEDLSGPAGGERVLEELLLRVNAAIRPAEVRDVVLKDMRIE